MKTTLKNVATVASMFTVIVCAATLGILAILMTTGADESIALSTITGFLGLRTGSTAANISLLAGLAIALAATTCLALTAD